MHSLGELRHVAVIELPGRPIVDFYALLGFSHCIVQESPKPDYLGHLSGGAFRHASIAKYSNANGSVLEVISIQESNLRQVTAWSHLAITVDDCIKRVEQLGKMGGNLVGGPVQSPDGPYLVAYMRDASGNLVELVQRTDQTW